MSVLKYYECSKHFLSALTYNSLNPSQGWLLIYLYFSTRNRVWLSCNKFAYFHVTPQRTVASLIQNSKINIFLCVLNFWQWVYLFGGIYPSFSHLYIQKWFKKSQTSRDQFNLACKHKYPCETITMIKVHLASVASTSDFSK